MADDASGYICLGCGRQTNEPFICRACGMKHCRKCGEIVRTIELQRIIDAANARDEKDEKLAERRNG